MVKAYSLVFLRLQRWTSASASPESAPIFAMSLLQFVNLLVVWEFLSYFTGWLVTVPKSCALLVLASLLVGNYAFSRRAATQNAIRGEIERMRGSDPLPRSLAVVAYILVSVLLVFVVPLALRR